MLDAIASWMSDMYHILYLIGIGLFAFTIFGLFGKRIWEIFKGSMKAPAWLERLYTQYELITSVPRALGRVLFVHPLKLIEEILITLIILAQKLRSRVALIIITLWTAIFIVILKPNADFELFTGLATLIGSSTFIILRFFGMSEEDKKRDHEKMMDEVKKATKENKNNGGDSNA